MAVTRKKYVKGVGARQHRENSLKPKRGTTTHYELMEKLMSGKGEGIEKILREIEFNKHNHKSLNSDVDTMYQMDDDPLFKLILLQAKECVGFNGKEPNPSVDSAIESYLSTLKGWPSDKGIELWLKSKCINPKNQTPQDLAAYHHLFLPNKFPKWEVEDSITGIEHYLKGRSRLQRRMYDVFSYGNKVCEYVSDGVHFLAKTIVLVGILAGTFSIGTHWDSIKKQLSPQVKKVTDANDDSWKDSQDISPELGLKPGGRPYGQLKGTIQYEGKEYYCFHITEEITPIELQMETGIKLTEFRHFMGDKLEPIYDFMHNSNLIETDIYIPKTVKGPQPTK